MHVYGIQKAQLLCLLHAGMSLPNFFEEIIAFACNRNTEAIKVPFDGKQLDGCLTVHLPHEIMWNANLMQ